MKRQSTETLDPAEKLAAAVLADQARLLATARQGRATDPHGAVLVIFDETQGHAHAVYLPDAEVKRALAANHDEALQEGYALFSLMSHLAPWTVIVIAYLYTKEDRTYSVMTALDMFGEWNQERQKVEARWLN